MKRTATHLLRQSVTAASSRLLRQPAVSHGCQRLARQVSSATTTSTSSSLEHPAPSRPVVKPVPNNTPQEDYASPTMYTFGIIGRIFRYSIYASVLIVLGGSATYAVVHAYVEYVALHGRSPLSLDEEQQLYYQLDDLLPGYSGAHLGGGTDPGLGWRGRNAARAAWLASHLRKGGIMTRVRGQHSDLDIPDSAWLEAERYLLFALQEADKQKTDTRLAKREILQQLAEIRSSMAGARGLAESKRNFQELILDVSEDSTMDKSVRAARLLHLETRLAMVEARIVREVLSRNAAGRARAPAELSQVLQRLQQAILHSTGGLELNARDAEKDATRLASEPASPESSQSSVKRSWLSWRGAADQTIQSVEEEKVLPVDNLLRSLNTVPLSISPILQRALIASCITLSGALAEEKRLQDSLAIAQVARRILTATAATNSRGSSLPEATQHALWLRGRQATLDTMLAEIAYTTGDMDAQGCNRLLSNAVQECQSCLASAPDRHGATLLQPAHPLYTLSYNEAVHLKRTGIAAAQLKGVLAEKTERNYKHALQYYETALNFTSDDAGGHLQDQTLLQTNLLEAIRRCRNKLLPLANP